MTTATPGPTIPPAITWECGFFRFWASWECCCLPATAARDWTAGARLGDDYYGQKCGLAARLVTDLRRWQRKIWDRFRVGWSGKGQAYEGKGVATVAGLETRSRDR